MEQRTLGKTGLSVSVLGFPGIALNQQEQPLCDRVVAEALDAGLTYFDIAPSYGNAQDRMGPALAGHRDRVVLNCKTTERSAGKAMAELEGSLKALQTDHFDVYQFHAVTTDEDVDQILAPGGAMEAYLKARDQGKIRHIGLSAHNEAAAIRLIEAGGIETALFPINFPAWRDGAFGPALLDCCNNHDVAVLALKALARRRYEEGENNPHPKRVWYVPEDRAAIAHLQLRFTLNQPGVCAAIPPGLPELMHLAIGFTSNLGPLSDEEMKTLEEAVSREQEPVFRS